MFEVSRLHMSSNGSNIRAYADVLVGDLMLIKGVRVVTKKDGQLFVAMPQQMAKDGKWYEIIRLLDKGIQQNLREVVLRAFNSENK